MPELPDVEAFRRYCSRTILKKRIKGVEVRSKRILDTSVSSLKKLEGERFISTSRHGKYLFLNTKKESLMLHFGMTGEVFYSKVDDIPEYAVLIIRLEKGTFSVISKRKLGKIERVKDIDKYVEENDLGPDALSMKKEEFIDMVKDSRGMIKTLLMDQSKICGIGNIYTDEILYQIGFHPKKDVSSLGEKDIQKLHSATKRILKTAVDNNADTDRLPRRYLLRDRSEGADCGICGGKIKKIAVNGRGTYFCPSHQKK